MRKEYDKPEIELIHLNLNIDVLGKSTWTPEETIVEEIDEPDL